MKNKKLTKFLLTLCCMVMLLSGAIIALPQKTNAVYAATVDGTTITGFGTYNNTALDWDILGYVQTNGSIVSASTATEAQKTDNVLIVSCNVIKNIAFDEVDDRVSNVWTTSAIRYWLNNLDTYSTNGFLASFTTTEKNAILKSTIQIADTATSYTANSSGDSCFILSYTDVFENNIFGNTVATYDEDNEDSYSKNAKTGTKSWWWLRTARNTHTDDTNDDERSYIVDQYGSDYNALVDDVTTGGVVPAMFVNITMLGSGNQQQTPSTGIKLDNTSMFVSASILFASLIALGFVVSKRKKFN